MVSTISSLRHRQHNRKYQLVTGGFKNKNVINNNNKSKKLIIIIIVIIVLSDYNNYNCYAFFLT